MVNDDDYDDDYKKEKIKQYGENVTADEILEKEGNFFEYLENNADKYREDFLKLENMAINYIIAYFDKKRHDKKPQDKDRRNYYNVATYMTKTKNELLQEIEIINSEIETQKSREKRIEEGNLWHISKEQPSKKALQMSTINSVSGSRMSSFVGHRTSLAGSVVGFDIKTLDTKLNNEQRPQSATSSIDDLDNSSRPASPIDGTKVEEWLEKLPIPDKKPKFKKFINNIIAEQRVIKAFKPDNVKKKSQHMNPPISAEQKQVKFISKTRQSSSLPP